MFVVVFKAILFIKKIHVLTKEIQLFQLYSLISNLSMKYKYLVWKPHDVDVIILFICNLITQLFSNIFHNIIMYNKYET